MKILVTGGAGFIGSHFTDLLLKSVDSEIVVIDDFSTGQRSNLPDSERIRLIEGDVSDRGLIKEIFNQYQFQYIFHFAAIASVQDSIIDPERTHKINFDSVLYILEECRRQRQLKRFVFAGSAAVYGNEPKVPCSESDMVNPLSPYGIDKYAAERYALTFGNLYQIPVTVFRFFNIYGPRQNPTSPYSGVISIFAHRFLHQEKPEINIYGDGRQTRDFVFVKDLTEIMWETIQFDHSAGQVYNVGTGKQISLLDLVNVLSEITDKTYQINYSEERDGDIKHSCADNTKIQGILQSYTFSGLKKGIDRLLRGNQ